MGLWKNKADNETVETEEYDFDKLEEQMTDLRQKALDYVSDLNKTSGITVKAEGKGFDKNLYYIFYVNDTDYVFIPKLIRILISSSLFELFFKAISI